VHQASLVRQWSDDVVLFDSGAMLDEQDRATLAARSVRIVEGKVVGLVVEDDKLRAVRMADGTAVNRSALFVPPKFVPIDDLLAGLGCERDGEEMIKVDDTGRTSVAGVWAVGNVVDRAALVVTAAAAGARAAAAVNMDFVEQEVGAASAGAPRR
jgi:thioredoxin reductase (NADPH)